MDAKDWVIVSVAVLGFLFAFYKWIVSRGDKRRSELKIIHDERLDEHSARLDRHSARLNNQDEIISLLKDDISKNYPTNAQLQKLEESIKTEIVHLHERLGGMSRDLNQALGKLQQSQNNEMTSLVKEIRQALEHKHD